jgi:hypothetical protein
MFFKVCGLVATLNESKSSLENVLEKSTNNNT